VIVRSERVNGPLAQTLGPAFSDLYIYLLKGESYSPFTDPMNPPGSNRKSEAHVRLPVPKVFCEACEKTLDFVRTNYYSLPIKLRDWLSAAQLTGLRVNERSKNVGFWKDFFEAV